MMICCRSVPSLLRRSRDQLGQTVVVVSHDPRAASYADRVVFLQDGQVASALRFKTDSTASQNLRQIMETMEKLES